MKFDFGKAEKGLKFLEAHALYRAGKPFEHLYEDLNEILGEYYYSADSSVFDFEGTVDPNELNGGALCDSECSAFLDIPEGSLTESDRAGFVRSLVERTTYDDVPCWVCLEVSALPPHIGERFFWSFNAVSQGQAGLGMSTRGFFPSREQAVEQLRDSNVLLPAEFVFRLVAARR